MIDPTHPSTQALPLPPYLAQPTPPLPLRTCKGETHVWTYSQSSFPRPGQRRQCGLYAWEEAYGQPRN